MTTTATSSAALVLAEPVFSAQERLALAGFLAGYSGMTREAYALDLRQFAAWCHRHQLRLFAVRRADIEWFARDLEAAGRARAGRITRRLSTIAGLYRYAVEEYLLDHSPAVHVRRPRIDYESHATGLDRNEVGALLVAAGLGTPAEHALISPLALNGLRVSETTGADIEALGTERGHRTLAITRKGGRHPACAENGPGDRPGHRGTMRRADLRDNVRAAAGPARRRADCPPGSPAAPGWPRRSGRTRCGTHSSPPRK